MITDVQVEKETLDDGYPVMWSDLGTRVRLAYDPAQISEASALVALCVHIPRLAGHMQLRRLGAP